MKRLPIWSLSLVLACAGCATLQQTAQHDFADGFFRVRMAGEAPVRRYAAIGEDSILLYPVSRTGGKSRVDTLHPTSLPVPERLPQGPLPDLHFHRTSMDLDLMTIIFRYRPRTGGLPPQLNATFNGAVYAGYRQDYYHLHYLPSPTGGARRTINHFGFDAGPFAGLGSSTLNADVTRGALPYEYDGLVFQKGIAAFIGLNNLTFGVALGWDSLLDGNRDLWIYRQEPWVGIGIGLALY